MAESTTRRLRRPIFTAGVLIWIGTIILFPLPVMSDPPPTQETPQSTELNKKALVQQSVEHYEQGDMAKSKEGLETAATLFPENYAVPYYLGLICLKQGDLQGAVKHWQQYLKMAPQSDNTLKIHKNVTLLLREEAEAFAKQAVAGEVEFVTGAAGDNAIAITSFSNLGSESLGPLGKGMAAMLITDLSQVPDLQVVDRIKLHALLKEMELGTTGLVDMETAPRVGRLLRAKHITSGTLADIGQDNLMIASAVVDIAHQKSIGAQEAQGVLKRFYELEKKIACQVIEDLGKDCKTVPDSFNKIHTKSMVALTWYSQGLDAFDQEDYDLARERFQQAIEEDPQFELAATALVATPTSTMAFMTTSQIISSASTGAPSSTVAAGSVVGSSTTGSVITASSTAGGVGIPPMTAVAAGAAIVGGGVALAGGGGGGGDPGSGDDPGETPSEQANLHGDWRGNWEDALGISGEATFSMTQTGKAVNGTISVANSKCFSTGDISGDVSGNKADLSIRSEGEFISLSATCDMATKTLNGTWTYIDSEKNCAGDRGNFSTTLTTGGAEFRW